MTMDTLGKFSQHQRAANCTAATIELRHYHLKRLQRELGDPLALGVEDLELWLCRPTWGPATRRSHRATLRAFYRWALNAGLIQTDPCAQLPPVRAPRGLPRPTPELAYRQALARADDRERRMIRLGSECGLRRGEISRVRGDDLVRDLLGWSLRVAGKGGHVRPVPVPEDLAEDLRSTGLSWVFPSPFGGHLTPGHVGVLVSRLLPNGIATHSLRHRAGTRAYAGTKDLRAVQEFLGHARPETTAVYTQVPASAIRLAMESAAA